MARPPAAPASRCREQYQLALAAGAELTGALRTGDAPAVAAALERRAEAIERAGQALQAVLAAGITPQARKDLATLAAQVEHQGKELEAAVQTSAAVLAAELADAAQGQRTLSAYSSGMAPPAHVIDHKG